MGGLPPGQRPPEQSPLLDRDSLGQRSPLDRDPWIETPSPLDTDPPLDRDPLPPFWRDPQKEHGTR